MGVAFAKAFAFEKYAGESNVCLFCVALFSFETKHTYWQNVGSLCAVRFVPRILLVIKTRFYFAQHLLSSKKLVNK